ncbi:MAG: LacI family DNA-binding transcriptional regulator [Bacillota bacterium]
MNFTIKEVAKQANVSVATVSRVLNDLGGYSEDTKERVLKVIEQMGYQPNTIARGLVTKNTKTIGVLLPNVKTIFYGEIIDGIEDTAHMNNYSVVVCNTGIDGNRTLEYLKVLTGRQVDGIIITSLTITNDYYKALAAIKVPIILVSTESYRLQVPYVKVDDKQAAYSAAQYLIEMGHTDIAMISGTPDDPVAGEPRINGYLQALQDYGIPINKKLIKHGNFSYQSGITCMEELLSEKNTFSAVFAASDNMAVGALSVAYKKGIKVPDELSVIGYDNTPVAEMAIPPLTVVAQPLYNMGKTAMEKLLSMIKTQKRAESIILPHKIVERNTVRRL